MEAKREGEEILFNVEIPEGANACFSFGGEMRELSNGKNEIFVRGTK